MVELLSHLHTALPEVITNVSFGGGTSFQPIHFDELRCSGAEATLLNCTHNGLEIHDCTHGEDVGIMCKRYQGANITAIMAAKPEFIY